MTSKNSTMRTKLFGIAAATAAIIVAGCSGGGGKSKSAGSVGGTIGGATMDVRSAAFATVTVASNVAITVGALTDAASFCDDLGTVPPTFHANQKVVFFQIGEFSGATITPAGSTGAYTWFDGSGAPPAKLWAGGYNQLDAACVQSTSASAAFGGGTLDVTALSSSAISGGGSALPLGSDTLDVTFNFEACPALGALFMSTTTASTCAN